MAYSRFLIVNFGPAYSGLSTVGYTLQGGTRSTVGVSELQAGTGTYGVLGSIPDGTQGFVKWDTGGASPAYAFEEINPRGATENLDVKVSSVSSAAVDPATVAAAVWNSAIASYTAAGSFGAFLQNRLDVAVGTRLAATGYTAPPTTAATAAAVWGYTGGRTVDMTGVPAAVWAFNGDRTLSAFAFNVTIGGYALGMDPETRILSVPANKLATDASGRVTVASNADKGGYTLVAAYDRAKTAATPAEVSPSIAFAPTINPTPVTVNPTLTADQAAKLESVATRTGRVDGLLESSGGHDRFKATALEAAPAGGGGGDGSYTDDDRTRDETTAARVASLGSRPAVFVDTIGRRGEFSIRRGYARKAIHGNAIGPFVFSADLAGATIELRGVGVAAAFKPTKAFADGKWTVTFDLDDAESAALEVGTYAYLVAAIYPDGSEVDPVERQSGVATVL